MGPIPLHSLIGVAVSSRPVVAILASADMLPWAERRRDDAAEGDAQIALMREALAQVGRDIEIVQWDGEGIDWSRYEAAITSITWDYAERPEQFLSRLAEIAEQARLVNSLDVIRWNLNKTYLKELAKRGVQLVPTHWVDKATPQAADAAFAPFNTDRIVIKPVVGAGAWRQVLLRKGEAWPDAADLPPAAAMIQPFLSAIQTEGEYSFLFFNGQFSHAVVKRPKKDDYRIQMSFGGKAEPYMPSADDLDDARNVLESVPEELFHARVDMVRAEDGSLLLMELEVIEPYLFIEDAPDFIATFAAGYDDLMTDESAWVPALGEVDLEEDH